jgi:hypothetical protein
MSIADTADYQLGVLAETLTRLNRAVLTTPESTTYKETYQAALADVGKAMALTSSTEWHY